MMSGMMSEKNERRKSNDQRQKKSNVSGWEKPSTWWAPAHQVDLL
jgi:hypothetical protein